MKLVKPIDREAMAAPAVLEGGRRMTRAATDQAIWVIGEAYRASPVALAASFGMSPWEVEGAQRRHAQLMARSIRISRESWEAVAAELVGAAGY